MTVQGANTPGSALGQQHRIGRALVYVHQQVPAISNPAVRGRLGVLIAVCEAMDFAVRLRGHGRSLTPALAVQFALLSGIPEFRLFQEILPRLKSADLVEYEVDLQGVGLRRIEEYVGLSGRVIDQAVTLLETYGPSDVERAVLHSTEIASWSPLTRSNHLEQLIKRGFTEEISTDAMQLALAAGINQSVNSSELGERVIYNPNVWGAEHSGVAGFVSKLPPAERDSLLGMVEQAALRPGLAVSSYASFSPTLLNSARKVGLVQAATVRSSLAGAAPQTYVFSPVAEAADDRLQSTEALHERKLFVAHILYGHEKSAHGLGRIMDPRILVDRLLSRGTVGPASNIATDYHLLEAAGIVAVRRAGSSGRAYLDVVKRDVIEGGLGYLRAAFGSNAAGSSADIGDLRPPSEWVSPEVDRAQIVDEGAAAEITASAVLRLRQAREEAQRAARNDF